MKALKLTLLILALFCSISAQIDPRESQEEADLGVVIQQLRAYVNMNAALLLSRLDSVEILIDSGIVLAETLGREKLALDLSPVQAAPVYTVNNADMTDIQPHWIEQLKDNIDYGAHGIYQENCSVIRQWLSSSECSDIPLNWIKKRQQILRCFADAKKVVLLLKKQAAQLLNYSEGDVLFADSFNTGASTNNYTFYGDGSLNVIGGRLQYLDPPSKPDCHFWTKQVYDGNFSISFDFQPLQPVEGGHIVSYCAMPLTPGGTLAGSGQGLMGDYFNTITCYHYSIARGNTGVSNLRKCGPGLWMCANSWDPCQPRNATYHVQVFKIENNHLMYVDGDLLHHFIDAGTYGDSLYNSGYIGIRNWTGLDAWYDNLIIRRLNADDSSAVEKAPGKRLPEISVSPNPFSSSTTITVRTKGALSIYGVSGKLIRTHSISLLGSGAQGASLIFQSDNLPAGIYLVKVTDKDRHYTRQMILW